MRNFTLPSVRILTTLLCFAVFGVIASYLRQFAVMAPVDLYLIAWHEAMHAAGAWVTGGSVHSIEVRARDGATWTTGGFFPLIAMAGYIGTALWGASLLASARQPTLIWPMRIMTVTLPPVAMLFGNGFSWSMLAVIAISVALSFVWRKYPRVVTLVVSGIFASESWRDVQMYLFSIPGQTDAGILAKYLGLQILTLPIALSMAILSGYIWWVSFSYTYQRPGNRIFPAANPTR